MLERGSSQVMADFTPCPYTIYPYRPEMLPAILALTRTALNDNRTVPQAEGFWHWKHQSSPFGPSYGVYAWAEQQQTAVGLRLLMRWVFRSPDGQRFQAARAVDTATHPSYRRRGIFSKLTRQAIEGLSREGTHFIFNTPNRYSLPGYLKMGWQVVTQWPLFIKILRPVRMAARRLKVGSPAPPPGQFGDYFKADIMSWPVFAGRYRQVAAGLVAAWESQRVQGGLRTPRTWDYLQWRYGQHPYLSYGVYAFEEAHELAGLAVLRPNQRYGWQEIVLTELFLSRADIALGRRLLARLAGQVGGDYLIAHFAAGTLERRLIKQAGFIKVPRQGMTFTVRSLNELPLDITTPAGWDFSLGDLELF